MRILLGTLACALLLMLACNGTNAADKKLSSGTIKKLVKEYVDDETPQRRRDEIEVALDPVEPTDLTKHLSRHCKDEAERPKALQLAVGFKVPGLFKYLESGFDSLDQQAIIDWCLLLKDEDGLEFLLEKWNELSLDSKEWQRIDEGFRTHRQDAPTLDKFRDKVGDVARGSAAMKILRWQLEKPDVTPEQIKSDWTKLRADFIRTYKTFPIVGHDVLAMDGWVGDKTVPAGSNVRVPAGGWWEFAKFPDTMGSGRLELTIRVCHISGDDGYVGLFQREDGATNGYKFDFKPEGFSYCDPSGRVISSVPYKAGEWQELKFVVKHGSKGDLSCSMYADGKCILDNGLFNQEPTVIGFFSKDVEFLAGGADLQFIKK